MYITNLSRVYSGVVRKSRDRVVVFEWRQLGLVLKNFEELQTSEGSCGLGVGDSRWPESPFHQLLDLTLRCLSAPTEIQRNLVNHVAIDDDEVIVEGFHGDETFFTGRMAELYPQPQGLQ